MDQDGDLERRDQRGRAEASTNGESVACLRCDVEVPHRNRSRQRLLNELVQQPFGDRHRGRHVGTAQILESRGLLPHQRAYKPLVHGSLTVTKIETRRIRPRDRPRSGGSLRTGSTESGTIPIDRLFAHSGCRTSGRPRAGGPGPSACCSAWDAALPVWILDAWVCRPSYRESAVVCTPSAHFRQKIAPSPSVPKLCRDDRSYLLRRSIALWGFAHTAVEILWTGVALALSPRSKGSPAWPQLSVGSPFGPSSR